MTIFGTPDNVVKFRPQHPSKALTLTPNSHLGQGNHRLFLGFLALKYLIAWLLFQDFFAQAHDNLDSEVVYSVVKGRFLASGLDTSVFQVFLGGALEWFYFDRILSPLTALYAVFPARWAYVMTEVFGLVLAYGGMVVLLREMKVPPRLSGFFATVFAFGLSFSSFGLGLHAAPILIYATMRGAKAGWWGIFWVFLLGTCSSFIVHGLFIPVLVATFWLAFEVRVAPRQSIAVLASFLAGSLIASFPVIYAMFQGIESHRADWQTTGLMPDISDLAAGTLGNLLTLGTWGHAQYLPAVTALFFVIAGLISGNARVLRATGIIVLFIVTASLLRDLKPVYAPYLPSGLASVQLDRFGLFASVLLSALGAAILTGSHRRMARGMVIGGGWFYLVIALLSGSGISIDNLKSGVSEVKKARIEQELSQGSFLNIFSTEALGENALTWSVFRDARATFGAHFQPETYRCFRRAIGAGRTMTVGYDPMVAAYHGIRVLDGYHNFYPLSYKRRFETVIAGQLALSEKWATYFGSWGSRVYTFVDSGETLALNFKAAKEMGATHVISAFDLADPSLKQVAPECGGESGLRLYEIAQE